MSLAEKGISQTTMVYIKVQMRTSKTDEGLIFKQAHNLCLAHRNRLNVNVDQ